jgi:hypothetical protein
MSNGTPAFICTNQQPNQEMRASQMQISKHFGPQDRRALCQVFSDVMHS